MGDGSGSWPGGGAAAVYILCHGFEEAGGIVKGPPLTASVSSGNPAFARRKAQRTPEHV